MTNFSRWIYSWTCFIRCKKNFDHILYGTHSRAKWSLGCRFQNLAPRRRHFVWNLKCEYFRKERSCGAKTFMANRYYNVCYAESIVFMFHQLLRFIITKQSVLNWRRDATAAPLRRQFRTLCFVIIKRRRWWNMNTILSE